MIKWYCRPNRSWHPPALPPTARNPTKNSRFCRACCAMRCWPTGASLFVERLVAEITALAPGRPLTLAWAKGTPPLGIALAAELDHLAVTKDLPDLRSLA